MATYHVVFEFSTESDCARDAAWATFEHMVNMGSNFYGGDFPVLSVRKAGCSEAEEIDLSEEGY